MKAKNKFEAFLWGNVKKDELPHNTRYLVKLLFDGEWRTLGFNYEGYPCISTLNENGSKFDNAASALMAAIALHNRGLNAKMENYTIYATINGREIGEEIELTFLNENNKVDKRKK